MSETQALAENFRVDRVMVGDRQYEGPGIQVILPSKGQPYWMFRIWGQHTVICAHTPIMMEVTELAAEVEEEIPEEE